MRLWKANNRTRPTFVRVLPATGTNDTAIVLCDERGNRVMGGTLLTRHGGRCAGVNKEAAEEAGIKLDAHGKLDDESFAEILEAIARELG